jgi:type III pantothenate kinase
MTPDVVVDIGNTRVKWGRVNSWGVVQDLLALPHDNPASWDQAIASWWEFELSVEWAAAGVHPAQLDRFTRWAEARGDRVTVIRDYRQLPLVVAVNEPDRVGIDRLLNAVAAKQRAPAGTPLVVIDVGSAVTVDYVDGRGDFVGGAIYPGPRLMAKALNDYTAKLPFVEPAGKHWSAGWGRDTRSAIGAGIAAAVIGGASVVAERIAEDAAGEPWVFLTGGDADYFDGYDFGPRFFDRVQTGETLTLEGIRIAAEALP